MFDWHDMNSGGVLDPLLFIVCNIFIIYSHRSVSIIQIILFCLALSILLRIWHSNEAMAKVWHTKNILQLNVDKTQTIIFINKVTLNEGDIGENIQLLGLVFFIVRCFKDMVSDSPLLNLDYSIFQWHAPMVLICWAIHHIQYNSVTL